MDDFPKWFLRIVGAIGLVAFVTTYAMRHDFSKGWMPSFNEDYAPPSASTPAPAAPAAPQPTDAGRPVAEAPPAAPAAGARGYVPCQPIGRTGKGELVYSMDCRNPPQ